MPWFTEQSEHITLPRLEELMRQTAEEARRRICPRPKRVLLLPPDITRAHSGAGRLTELLYKHFAGEAEVHVIPTLGPARAAHAGGESAHVRRRFPKSGSTPTIGCGGCVPVGEVPADFVKEQSHGGRRLADPRRAQRMLMDGSRGT